MTAWSPFPGMYPVVIAEGARLLTVHIWDADATEARIRHDLGTIFDGSDLAAVAVHFGTADEIAALVRDKAPGRAVIIDLEGTSRATQAVFARAMEGDPILTVRIE